VLFRSEKLSVLESENQRKHGIYGTMSSMKSERQVLSDRVPTLEKEKTIEMQALKDRLFVVEKEKQVAVEQLFAYEKEKEFYIDQVGVKEKTNQDLINRISIIEKEKEKLIDQKLELIDRLSNIEKEKEKHVDQLFSQDAEKKALVDRVAMLDREKQSKQELYDRAYSLDAEKENRVEVQGKTKPKKNTLKVQALVQATEKSDVDNRVTESSVEKRKTKDPVGAASKGKKAFSSLSTSKGIKFVHLSPNMEWDGSVLSYRGSADDAYAISAAPLCGDTAFFTVTFGNIDGWTFAGIIGNTSPSTTSYGDATSYGWGSIQMFPLVCMKGKGQNSYGGWEGWEPGDVGVFKFERARKMLSLHLVRTKTTYSIEAELEEAYIQLNLHDSGDSAAVRPSSAEEMALMPSAP